jgi:hypothetical protein
VAVAPLAVAVAVAVAVAAVETARAAVERFFALEWGAAAGTRAAHGIIVSGASTKRRRALSASENGHDSIICHHKPRRTTPRHATPRHTTHASTSKAE